ncbi:hypothetical protein [Clostridium weizhouense]|uniref:Uncharacterized protein n=1 Tax=Clostridium weizhouense TaxID=2859781 RepID=A0ABS7AS58_9CLOT|nr:hypothetical protein [Clostridium weizhouense]MBW6411379.1 hypothetical protein [Clostridium weizhouense]
MNNRIKAFSIIGLLIEVLTIFIFFMLTKDRTSISWICLIFMLLAELILFAGHASIEYIAQRSSQIIIRAGIGVTLVGYGVISFLISLMFIKAEGEYIKYFISLQATLLIFTAVLIIVFIISGNKIRQDSNKVLNATNKISIFIERINLLKVDPNNKNYEKFLDKVYESLRYSDVSATVPSDSDLEVKITKLEVALLSNDDHKNDKVINLIEEILMLINKRKSEVKNIKLGGI